MTDDDNEFKWKSNYHWAIYNELEKALSLSEEQVPQNFTQLLQLLQLDKNSKVGKDGFHKNTLKFLVAFILRWTKEGLSEIGITPSMKGYFRVVKKKFKKNYNGWAATYSFQDHHYAFMEFDFEFNQNKNWESLNIGYLLSAILHLCIHYSVTALLANTPGVSPNFSSQHSKITEELAKYFQTRVKEQKLDDIITVGDGKDNLKLKNGMEVF